MKKTFFLSIIFLVLLSSVNHLSAKDHRAQNFNDTTSTPPKGTVFKNGKLHLKKGYMITFSEDKKIGTIRRANGNVITASVRCGCVAVGETGSCQLITILESLHCSGDECCVIEVTVGANNLAITTKAGTAGDGEIIWKVLVIPKTNITSSSN